MATPLKLRDGDGNIQELTIAEENYLTYLIGLHLAADSANGIGGITTNSGDTSIGIYTDTFFNEPVGTHPSTSISSGSTAGSNRPGPLLLSSLVPGRRASSPSKL